MVELIKTLWIFNSVMKLIRLFAFILPLCNESAGVNAINILRYFIDKFQNKLPSIECARFDQK